MNDHFICSVCGKDHEGLPTDWAFKLPDAVWAIPEHDRPANTHFNSDLCRFGESHFIRCILIVPFKDAVGDFAWGVWVEVQYSVFDRYSELFDEDGTSEPPYEGKLANALPPYPDALDTTVIIRFQDRKNRPSIQFRSDDMCDIAKDQRLGISNVRYHAILDSVFNRN